MRIIACEVNDSSKVLEFCWLPSEIKDSGGNIQFANYTMLDRGELARPSGNSLRKISWTGRFPGEARKGASYLTGEWTDPLECDAVLKRWQEKRKLISLTIEDTNISQFKCYLSDYSSTYSGGFGDLEYQAEWTAYRYVFVEALNKKTSSKDTVKRPAKETAVYAVKSGDTLWDIAAKHLGKGTRWKEIYTMNKTVIEAEAKKRGFSSSDNGNRIWPGTRLKLPKK